MLYALLLWLFKSQVRLESVMATPSGTSLCLEWPGVLISCNQLNKETTYLLTLIYSLCRVVLVMFSGN